MPNEIVVTLKGDGSAPWIVVHGDDVHEATALLDEATKGDLFQAASEGGTLLAASTKIANGMAQDAAPAQAAGVNQYQNQGRQQVQQNQGARPPAQGSGFNGTPHPQGLVCQMCGAGIVGKQPREKKMWTCPNQRTKGDGHYMEWING